MYNRPLALILAMLFASTGAAEDLPVIQPVKFRLRHEHHRTPAVFLSADGSRAAINHATDEFDSRKERKGAVQIWDLRPKPKLVAAFSADEYCVALSPSGKRMLVYNYQNYKCEVFDVESRKPLTRILPDSVSHMVFRDDDTLILTNRSFSFRELTPGRITTWSVSRNEKIDSFDIPDNRFGDAVLSRGGKEMWLFMSKDKFELERWDLKEKKLVRRVRPEVPEGQKPYRDAGLWGTATLNGSAFSSVADPPIGFTVYDSETGKIIGTCPAGMGSMHLGIFPAGTLVLVGPNGGTKGNDFGLKLGEYLVYDWKAKKGLAILRIQTLSEKRYDSSIRHEAVSADGKVLVSVTMDGEGQVYDLSPIQKK